MSSLFITFEGPEGAGKTTVLKAILGKLQEQGIDYLATREPGGIEIAEKIREIILNPAHTMMDARTEALLYAAARSQHFYEKVEPALAADQLVLCDRFVDSSLVYQGLGRALGVEEVRTINQFAIGTRMPDKTILFDLEPAVGLARIQANRQQEINRLDQESLAFHEKVRAGYLDLAKAEPNRIIVIDASQPLDTVIKKTWRILREIIMESK